MGKKGREKKSGKKGFRDHTGRAGAQRTAHSTTAHRAGNRSYIESRFVTVFYDI